MRPWEHRRHVFDSYQHHIDMSTIGAHASFQTQRILGNPYKEFLKRGGPRDPKGYRGSIRGLYRAPLRDYIGVILRNTHKNPRLDSGHSVQSL